MHDFNLFRTYHNLSLTNYETQHFEDNYLFEANFIQSIKIISVLMNRFATPSLLAIDSILTILKNSDILSETESKLGHLKIWGILQSKGIDLVKFLWWNISFTTTMKIIRGVFRFLWWPFKLALIFYILYQLGFDVTNLYYQINNLSMGIIDWYYQSLIDFLESLRENYYNTPQDHDSILTNSK